MHLHLNCPDCGWVIQARFDLLYDTAKTHNVCPRCGCVVCVDVFKQRDGNPKFKGTVNLAGTLPVRDKDK